MIPLSRCKVSGPARSVGGEPGRLWWVGELARHGGHGSLPHAPGAGSTLIPTINVVTAKGWQAWRDAGSGRWNNLVVAFARGGSIIRGGCACFPTAMSSWPKPTRRRGPRTRQGTQGVVLQAVSEKKAGGAVPSANRITLLRDTDGDRVADGPVRCFCRG